MLVILSIAKDLAQDATTKMVRLDMTRKTTLKLTVFSVLNLD